MKPLFLVPLLAACAASGSKAAEAPAAGTLLVGNKSEDSLSFIDLATGAELKRLKTGRMPHEIALSPDGTQAAVVSYGGTSIDVFDVRSRQKLRTIDLAPNAGPHGLLWLPDGRLLATTERSRSVVLVDTRAGDSVRTIPIGEETTHMVAASGRLAFTANIRSGTTSVLDLAGARKIRDVAVAAAPEGIALSPDGRTLWVADLEGAQVSAFDASELAGDDPRALTPSATVRLSISNGSAEEVERLVVRPLEESLRSLPGAKSVTSTKASGGAARVRVEFSRGTAHAGLREKVTEALRRASSSFPKGRTEAEIHLLGDAPLATVATGGRPIRVAVSPDGRWVVTSDFESGGLTVIDARARTKVRTIPVSGSADAQQVTILFSADGRRLYVAETGRNQVAEVDFESGRVLRRLQAGENGDGLAIAP